jgi:predicted O-methyltransferase YrrM
MKYSEIRDAVHGVPFISAERGQDLYGLVYRSGARRILELGFGHGASAAYMAAALDELGRGSIDCVDLEGMDWQKPSIEETLDRCGLARTVNIFREKSSYTWFLKKAIERQTAEGICQPLYDIVFIDGPKNWTIDGAAFFMAEKLLNEGGLIVFDDYAYAYGTEREVTDGINHRKLSADELAEPHIAAVFRLLVMQHPNLGRFQIINQQFAIAVKQNAGPRMLTITEKIGLWPKALRHTRRLRRLIQKA